VREIEARSSFFGYWEVLPHTFAMFKVHRLTPFMKFAEKRRNLDAADRMWNEAQDETETVIEKVKRDNQAEFVDIKLIAQVMLAVNSTVNPGTLKLVTTDIEKLFEPASLGIRVGVHDNNRIGEEPPVALGVHHGADLEMRTEGSKLFAIEGVSEKENPLPFVWEHTFHLGFYLARAGKLKGL
jgi:hypothetical protein